MYYTVMTFNLVSVKTVAVCVSQTKTIHKARYNQYVLLHLMCSFRPKSQTSVAEEDCKIHSRYTSLVLRAHSYKGVLHMLGNANRYLEPPCGVSKVGSYLVQL